MNAIFIILAILIVIASVLLTLVVLLQSGKGEGLASNFVAANQTLGVRQTADILEKLTWGLVAFILVLAIVSSFTIRGGSAGDSITDKIENAAPAAQPEFPVAPVASQDAPAEAPAAEEAPAK